MNLYFVYGDRIVTPDADRLHPGGHHPRLAPAPSPATSATSAEEGRVSVDQWQRDAENGALTEVFACGTAAVDHPGRHGQAHRRRVARSRRRRARRGHPAAARRRCSDIQRGTAEDKHGWMHRLGLTYPRPSPTSPQGRPDRGGPAAVLPAVVPPSRGPGISAARCSRSSGEQSSSDRPSSAFCSLTC